MTSKISFLSITYIIAGTLISIISGITDGMASVLFSIFGFIILFSGYNRLSKESEFQIKKGASKLRIAAIIGLIGSAIDLIPVLGAFSYIFYVISFVYQIFGMLDIRKSDVLTSFGKSGVTYIFVAMGFAILVGLVDFIPLIGGAMAEYIAYTSIALMFFGWTKIQESAC